VGRELEATRASETQGIRGVYGDGEFLTLGLGEDLLEGSIVGLVNSVMAPLAVEHIAEGGYALEGRDTLTKEVSQLALDIGGELAQGPGAGGEQTTDGAGDFTRSLAEDTLGGLLGGVGDVTAGRGASGLAGASQPEAG
jgi:hypothetical protein